MATCHILHVFVCLACFAKCVRGVQITSLQVPAQVRNGSGNAVILDCEYSLRPDDLTAVSGLVIKWFFNNGPAPVYQWIPGKKPQELGILRGRLKLEYKASQNVATMHRALYIVNPTTELSGDYKCYVSTFQEEDFMIKRMIVFAPEKRLDVVQSKTESQVLNITCLAEGVYPEPKILLYKDRVLLKGVTVETSTRGGQYDISATALLEEEHLDKPTVFHCELKLPGTNYTRHKSVTYNPGSMESLSSVSDKAEKRVGLTAFVTLVLITAIVAGFS